MLTRAHNASPKWRRFLTRVAAVVVRNFMLHLFDVTGNIHLFRSLVLPHCE